MQEWPNPEKNWRVSNCMDAMGLYTAQKAELKILGVWNAQCVVGIRKVVVAF